MTKKSKRKNNLKESIILLILLILLLVSSTYAWFTANQTVTISTIDVNIAAANGLQISTDADAWKAIISNEDITTNWYLKLINEIKTGGYQVKYAKKDDVYYVGKTKMRILEAETDVNGNMNNYSIVLKVSFGDIDTIMTGDAETDIEEKILDLQEKKKLLSDKIIEGDNRDKNNIGELTEKELRNLLSYEQEENN